MSAVDDDPSQTRRQADTGVQRTRRALTVFERLADLPAAEQARELARLSAEDPALEARVRRMLAEDQLTEDPDSNVISAALEGFQAPSSVGAYQILEPIGEGGMGAVYRAERSDGAFRRTVAIKFIQAAFASRATRQRFDTERQVMAELSHPAITQLLDGGTVQNQPYLVMEYIEGKPFSYDPALPRDRVLDRFLTVCDAVAHAHARLVLHRDLKPANILIDGAGRPKLLDFGVAKLLQSLGKSQPELTSVAGLPITPNYTAPECLNGAAASVASDVYALGVLLQEVTTGTRPYELAGSSLIEAQQRVLRGMPREPATGNRDLDLIIATACHPDLARRYPTVQSLAEDLRRLRTFEPVRARADDRWYVAGRFFRRNRTAVLSSAAGVLLLVGALGTALLALRESELSRQLAEQQVATATTAVSFLSETLSGANPLAGLPPLSTIDEALAKATRALDQQFDANPEARAFLHASLSLIHTGRGNFEVALKQAETAQEQLASGTQTRRLEAPIWANLAQSYFTMGRYPDAIAMSERGLAALDRQGQPETTARTEFLALRGEALVQLGDLDRALGEMEQALALNRRINLASGGTLDNRLGIALARAHNGIAMAHGRRNEHAAALTSLSAAIELLDAAGEGSSPNTLQARVNRAGMLSAARRYDEAQTEYAATLEAMREALGPEHPWVVWGTASFGLHYLHRGQAAQGVAIMAPLLTQVEANYTAEDELWSYYKAKLGYALCKSGRHRDGLEQLEASLRARRDFYPPGHWTVPDAESAIGYCQMQLGNLSAARLALTNAERDFVAALGPDNSSTQMARGWIAELTELEATAAAAAGPTN
ncbi:MAG: serine/threonine-protein kinase [Pseudomonadota bacterium]